MNEEKLKVELYSCTEKEYQEHRKKLLEENNKNDNNQEDNKET